METRYSLANAVINSNLEIQMTRNNRTSTHRRRRSAILRFAAMLVAAAGITLTPAFADHHGGGKHGMQGHPGGPDPDRFAEALELTDEQRVEVDEIMNEARRQREAAMTEAGSDASKAQRMERMRIIRDDTHSKLSEVLTDEQMTKLDTMRERHRARRMEHHQSGPKTKSEY